MKLIDKGFSKSEIKSICNSSANNNKTRWITPNNSKCVAYGGKIDKGVCTATWNTAKGICSGVGGRLPNINELKRVVTNCDGINVKIILGDNQWGKTANKNFNNKSYQSCYKEKG